MLFDGIVDPRIAISCLDLTKTINLFKGKTQNTKRNTTSIEIIKRQLIEELKGAELPADEEGLARYLVSCGSGQELVCGGIGAE